MKKPSVLICDDEEGTRESLKVMLAEDYTLAFAGNGEEAVRYVRWRHLDLLILDIKMPKVDGLEVLRQVKRLKPALKVLIVTGYESSDVAQQAIQLGADGYLTKPFDWQKVQSQLKALFPEL